MKRILALDLGTKTGWAVTLHESGEWDFTSRRFEGGGFRFIRFREAIQEILSTGIERVYFEEVRRHLGTDAAHIYGGLMAILMEICEQRKIPYSGVPVGTIKKHATGKGNADKNQMRVAAQARGWVNLKNHNHVDALWLLDYIVSNEPEMLSETRKEQK